MSIRIEALTKRFDDNIIFDNLSLEIPKGRVMALTGRSGCGKTTLLRMISGLDTDFSGRITGVPESKSFMFQEDRLLPWCDVRKNLEFVLMDVMAKEEMGRVIDDMLTAVDLAGQIVTNARITVRKLDFFKYSLQLFAAGVLIASAAMAVAAVLVS